MVSASATEVRISRARTGSKAGPASRTWCATSPDCAPARSRRYSAAAACRRRRSRADSRPQAASTTSGWCGPVGHGAVHGLVDQSGSDQPVEPHAEVVVTGQQRVDHVPGGFAPDAERGQDVEVGRAELVEPVGDHVDESIGQVAGRPGAEHPATAAAEQPALRSPRRQQRDHIERNSFGPSVEQLQQGLRRLAGQFARNQGGHLVRRQGAEPDIDDAVRPAQRRPEPADGIQRLPAVGDHEQAAVVAEAQRQIGEQVQRGRVGPMDVVDEQRDRPFRGRPPDQGVHRVEQPAAFGARLAGGCAGLARQPEPTEQPGQVGQPGGEVALSASDQRAQRLHQRREAHVRLEAGAGAAQRAEAGRLGLAEGLAGQAGLADARFTGDGQHQAPPTGDGRHGVCDDPAFGRAADEPADG